MRYKISISLVIIALMFLINQGIVFAEDGISINDIKYDDSSIYIKYSLDENREYSDDNPLYFVIVYYDSDIDVTEIDNILLDYFYSYGAIDQEIFNEMYSQFDIKFNKSVAITRYSVNYELKAGNWKLSFDTDEHQYSVCISSNGTPFPNVRVYLIDHGPISYFSQIKNFFVNRSSRNNYFRDHEYTSVMNTSLLYCGDGILSNIEECDDSKFWISKNNGLLQSGNTLSCSGLLEDDYPFYSKYKDTEIISGSENNKITCNSDCTLNISSCTYKQDNQDKGNSSNSGSSEEEKDISLNPINSSVQGYICDNHVCYFTDTYNNNSADSISFSIKSKQDSANINIFDLRQGMNINTEIITKLKTPATNKPSIGASNPLSLTINAKYEINLPINNGYFGLSDLPTNYNSPRVLSIGYPNTEKYDYYIITKVDTTTFSNLLLYKINNRRIIDFYGGSLPEWIPVEIASSQDNTPTVTECDEYITSLKNNFSIVDQSIFNYNNKTLDTVITAKRSDFDIVYKEITKFNNFNNNVFLVAKNGSNPLSEEETAQFWAILAQESTLGKNISNANTSDIGMAQINYTSWCSESKRTAGYNELKTYLDFGITSQEKYNSLCDDINKSRKFDYNNQELDASTVLARAIYLRREAQIRGLNSSDFPENAFKVYDDNDAIDAMFAVGYKYKRPSQTFSINKKYNSSNLVDYTSDIGAITQKIAFYLIYKEEMCKQFIKSYKDYYSNNLPTLKNGSSSSQNNNGSLNCPEGYIKVPGNSTYNLSDFCVMKYEAKKGSNDSPVSTATGDPWVDISQTNAIAKCSSLGLKYHLITNNEWMTIARNIEQVKSNWSGGAVGFGYIYSGHNDGKPNNALSASSNDSEGYYLTGQTSGNQRRTFTLTNGEIIWDLSGNVWEWTNNTIQRKNQPDGFNNTDDAANRDGFDWFDYSKTSGGINYLKSNSLGPTTLAYNDLFLLNSNYTATTNGIGRIFTYSDIADTDTTVYGFLRGGNWFDATEAGLLASSMIYVPGDTFIYIGFRCVVVP